MSSTSTVSKKRRYSNSTRHSARSRRDPGVGCGWSFRFSLFIFECRILCSGFMFSTILARVFSTTLAHVFSITLARVLSTTLASPRSYFSYFYQIRFCHYFHSHFNT